MGVLRIGMELNRGYITDTFCINKEVPEKLCSGQCFIDDFTENIVENEEEQPQNRTSEERSQSLNWLDNQLLTFLPAVPSSSIQNILPPLVSNYSFTPLIDFFHPPKG